jgi:predicted lipase
VRQRVQWSDADAPESLTIRVVSNVERDHLLPQQVCCCCCRHQLAATRSLLASGSKHNTHRPVAELVCVCCCCSDRAAATLSAAEGALQ